MSDPTSSSVLQKRLGRLFYVIGASGAGKDSLLTAARTRVTELGLPVAFAHRYITRPANAGGENHVAVTEAEYALRLEYSLFALSWDSHGLRYGVGTEINAWMHAGLDVVVNGSRGALARSRERYPELVAVLVDVAPDVLHTRLTARGREDAPTVKRRLERAAHYKNLPDVTRIDNNGVLDAAVERFLTLLQTR